MTSYPVDWYHQVPSHVKEILGTLQKAGFEALIVGGAVRDLWNGRVPHDYDLVSSASVDDIAKLFPKTLDIGKAFGIMVVVTGDGPVEVARFRTDGAYTDNRLLCPLLAQKKTPNAAILRSMPFFTIRSRERCGIMWVE
jgi:tRNA nucleotidyltransferase/poly(A) polymerase